MEAIKLQGWIAVGKKNGGDVRSDHENIEEFERDLDKEIEKLSVDLAHVREYRPIAIDRK